MENSLDVVTMARWRVVHTDYVMAHEQYLRAKLGREAGDGQPLDPAGAQIARARLEAAQCALSDFFNQYDEIA